VNETVLVVDDEARIRSSIRGILSDEGYRVLDTGDAPRAMEIIAQENPALVLLDVWMPGLDGIELLRQIKHDSPRTPVIMISGHANIQNAVAATRLVEGRAVGTAPPRRQAAGEQPAAGIRVLDLTRVIAGPVATRYLAALGADVLRLDPPHRPELPLHARDGLLGKRSGLLDFGSRDGAVRLHELLDGADMLVHGYRPHALDRFGLTADALAERHPGLVVVSLSAWGSTGPWGGRRGFDSIVQAACGIAVAESPDGERPGAMPCQLLDHGTGYLCAAAALRALAAQAVRGGTQVRELCLARTGQWLLEQGRADGPDGTAGGPDRASGGPDGTDPAWLIEMSSAEGTMTVVRPPGQLGGRDLDWPGPLTRYGSDPPAWR